MTVALACPPAATDPPVVAPRKRRRRAPASGASDDCFACSKRNIKCDRRRPYCSQCLEHGKECSGYKTQLTWGVGVASRGKLRGLSLPVAKSAPAIKSPTPRPRSTTSSSASSYARPVLGKSIDLSKRENVPKTKLELSSSLPNNPFTTYDFVNMAPDASSPIHIPPMNVDWNMPMQHDYMQPTHIPHPDSPSYQRPLPRSFHAHRLSQPMMVPRGDLRLSTSMESLSTYADSDYSSPMDQSFHADDASFIGSPVPMYSTFSAANSPVAQSPIAMMAAADARGPTSCPDQYYEQADLSSSYNSHNNVYHIRDHRTIPGSPAAQCNLSDIFYDDEILGGAARSNDSEVYHYPPSHQNWNSVVEEDARSQAHSDTQPSYRMQSQGLSPTIPQELSPRISFFLDYYEKIICPTLVVIDGPHNPYRHHILSMAGQSLSLQHAICALSACNLRMKRKQTSSSGPHLEGTPKPEDLPADDPSIQEEYQHRSKAVQLLNQQLSDPATAGLDSVLATLFILCHYRMCESGVAQFKTQFAGVKKLMGIRRNGIETGRWGWMETLFTFFDAMTATVNDREAQLRGGYLEMISSPPSQEAALENLAGCEGRLFRIIAKLGRLNILSQHRPVMDALNPGPDVHPPPPMPRPDLASKGLADYYNHKFEGTQFAAAEMGQGPSAPVADDMRPVFWMEWKEIRHELQNWQFDSSRLVSVLSVTPTPAQLRDFGNLSEAFRYAALIYTERLSSPHLPSTASQFQNLVSQFLYFYTSIEPGSSIERFLLWPLFVAGSECINEVHRNMVRTKCREFATQSGYRHSLATLDVLERLWAEGVDVRVEQRRAIWEGAFRWRSYMDDEHGEHIIV